MALSSRRKLRPSSSQQYCISLCIASRFLFVLCILSASPPSSPPPSPSLSRLHCHLLQFFSSHRQQFLLATTYTHCRCLCISFSTASCSIFLSYFGGFLFHHCTPFSSTLSLLLFVPPPASRPSIWTCRAVCTEQHSTLSAPVVCCLSKSCPLSSL